VRRAGATEPPLQGADDAFHAAVARHRGELGLLFQALQASLEGNAPLAQSSLQRLRNADPGNAYYRWIAPSAP
jgi:spermidine synthase